MKLKVPEDQRFFSVHYGSKGADGGDDPVPGTFSSQLASATAPEEDKVAEAATAANSGERNGALAGDGSDNEPPMKLPRKGMPTPKARPPPPASAPAGLPQ